MLLDFVRHRSNTISMYYTIIARVLIQRNEHAASLAIGKIGDTNGRSRVLSDYLKTVIWGEAEAGNGGIDITLCLVKVF